MKSYIIILFSFFLIKYYSQSDEAKNKILLVKEKLENVPAYSCDIKVKIDVSFIKIKERIGRMVFKDPKNIDYKIRGFSFLPKNEMGATTTDLFNSEFIAISLGLRTRKRNY